ncbi:hypothetical protein B0H34DRAFT_688539 [Crassisporium funariophilum]|nr:hypothetical protein B0H34DRAFT_688539 [Crassisporium funariophilum]
MAQISAFPLPLPLLPHSDFVYRGDDNSSTDSATTVFRTGITNGDVFGGVLRCIICGRENRTTLENCHLIPKVEKNTWDNLKAKRYLPSWVKSVEHESRNAVTFCVVHHKLFENYQVFIRYVREYDRYIYINYSDDPYETKYHGKAVGLNSTDRRAPFPTAFLIHEIRTRSFLQTNRRSHCYTAAVGRLANLRANHWPKWRHIKIRWR